MEEIFKDCVWVIIVRGKIVLLIIIYWVGDRKNGIFE